jgi:hypothetical protein
VRDEQVLRRVPAHVREVLDCKHMPVMREHLELHRLPIVACAAMGHPARVHVRRHRDPHPVFARGHGACQVPEVAGRHPDLRPAVHIAQRAASPGQGVTDFARERPAAKTLCNAVNACAGGRNVDMTHNELE